MDIILSIFVWLWFAVASTFLFLAIMNNAIDYKLVAPRLAGLTSNLWSKLHDLFTR